MLIMLFQGRASQRIHTPDPCNFKRDQSESSSAQTLIVGSGISMFGVKVGPGNVPFEQKKILEQFFQNCIAFF